MLELMRALDSVESNATLSALGTFPRLAGDRRLLHGS